MTMKNKRLLQKIDNYYYLANSAPLKKIAEAEEFDRAAENIKKHVIKVQAMGPNGKPQLMSQCMIVSTKAHNPKGWGLVPDDALIFIFLNKDNYIKEEEYPKSILQTAINLGIKEGIGTNKYQYAEINSGKVQDKKDAENSLYTRCVAVFKRD